MNEHIQDVIDRVTCAMSEAGVTVLPHEVLGKRRLRPHVMARGMACFIAREHLKMSYPAIGRAVRRGHAAIMHTEAVTVNDIETNAFVASIYKRVIHELGFKAPSWLKPCERIIVAEDKVRRNRPRVIHVDTDDAQLGLPSRPEDYIQPKTYDKEYHQRLTEWRKNGEK